MSSINHNVIAERLNLSRATVTRSLANHPSISAETRDRVLELAKELGYVRSPGRAIRRKKLSKNVTVGVLVGVRDRAPGTATFPFILKGIQQHAAYEQATIDVCYQNPDEFDPEGRRHRVFGQIRAANWRGVILIYPFSEPAIESLSRRITTVAALEDYVALGVDSIDTDHSAGIVALVQRLVRAGHRRIGFAAWHYPIGGHWTVRRFAAFVEGMLSQDVPLHLDWHLNVHPGTPELNREQLADAVVQRIRRDGVTAWVCAADHQAYELIRDLAARGVSVPRDCSVTGFDGIEPPYGLRPLTTALVPHEDIGAAALGRVMNRLLNPKSPARKILVGAEIVAGETVAPPPAAG